MLDELRWVAWWSRFGVELNMIFKNGKFPKIPFFRVRKKWVLVVVGDQFYMGFAGPKKLSKMRIVSGL